jgi:hypothetical protein
MTEATQEFGDPFYEDGAARRLRDNVQKFHRILILIEGNLGRRPAAASRREKLIWIRPGLDLTTFRRLISDSVAYITEGEAAAPMFGPATPARPWLAVSDGTVLPNPN